MLKRVSRIVAVSAAAVCALSTAQAATFTPGDFTFSGSGASATVDGITVNLLPGIFNVVGGGSSGAFSNPTNSATINVNAQPSNQRFVSNLGVEGFGIDAPGTTDDDPTIDGLESNDILLLSLPREFALTSITFDQANGGANINDDFVFFSASPTPADLATSNFRTLATFAPIPDGPGDSGAIAFGTPVVGQLFGIGGLEANDNFTVASFEITEVPLPGALPLMLTGLAGLGWMRRRKAARTA